MAFFVKNKGEYKSIACSGLQTVIVLPFEVTSLVIE